MFQQEIMQKKQQIEQLEKNLKQGYNNEFTANLAKEALEIRKNELKELEKMQKEYDLGIFDIYQYKYQEVLSYLLRLRQIRLGGRIFDNTQQKNDFIKKTMAQWEKRECRIKTANVFKTSFFMSPPPSKNLSTQKVLKNIESLQGFLRQANLA